jgi:hypothetical protein
MKRRELLESLVALPLIGLVTKAGRMKREVEVPKLVPPPKPIEAEDVGLPEFGLDPRDPMMSTISTCDMDPIYASPHDLSFPPCPKCNAKSWSVSYPPAEHVIRMQSVWTQGDQQAHWECGACGHKIYDWSEIRKFIDSIRKNE